VIVTNWFALTFVTRSFTPVGHSTSIAVTVSAEPSPNVIARSLCEQ